MIPPDDRGFTLGDGVFETVLADAGRLVAFERHIARMAEGAAALGLPSPEVEAAEQSTHDALERAGLVGVRAAVRLTWTAGSGGRGLERPEPLDPRLVVTVTPVPAATGPVRLALSTVRRNEGSPTSRHKTLAYLDNVLARRQARAAGADEAVMLNGRGELACCAAANLFWLAGDRLFTPALGCGVLAGLVRADTLACAARLGIEGLEVAAGPEALDGADAVFITNSLLEVQLAARPESGGGAAYQALARAVSSCRSDS
jgi:branched-chain amino acid aminotransferase/4-amino-4-deoxychorismate lyase